MWIKQVPLYNPLLQHYQRVSIQIQDHFITDIRTEIPKKCSPNEVFSLPGHFLYPGFVDSHCHLLGLGTSLCENAIFESSHPSDWYRHMSADNRQILVYRGWDEEKIGFIPTKQTIDNLPVNKPILFTRKCGHAGIVNSEMLRYCNLTSFHQVEGTDLSTGFLTEKALLFLRAHIQIHDSFLKNALDEASRFCHSMGIFSVHSEDCSLSNMDTLLPLLRNTPLSLHEKIMVNTPDEIDQVIDKSSKYEFTDKFCFGSCKIYMDGSLGAHNAFLTEPYSDQPDQKGFSFYSVDELIRFIQKANGYQKQLAIHVIGDEALEKCLQAFEYVVDHSETTLYHRLVHVQMASRSQLARIQKLPLWINLQPVFEEADRKMAYERLGKSRLQDIGYPFQAISSMNIPFSLSSDAPVETMNPFVILSQAERFMSRQAAFFAYTVAGAKQSGFSDQIGFLHTGSCANGFFLPCDLFQLTTDELSSMKPPLILLNGEILPASSFQKEKDETI